MKEMVKTVPLGACPRCGHRQFYVIDSTMNEYITNMDGEIVDSKEHGYRAYGMCVNCKREFEMMPTSYGFIPLTPLRKLFFEYTPHEALALRDDTAYEGVPSPMQKGN